MERNIKLRVWDEKYRKMIFDEFHLLGEVTAFGLIEQYLFETKETDHIPTIERWNDLIVMLFAYQQDKHKANIFVGDILSEKWKAEVFQTHEGTFMVRFHTNPTRNKPMSLKKYLQHRDKAGTSDRDNVIIGNIYENPDLISD